MTQEMIDEIESLELIYYLSNEYDDSITKKFIKLTKYCDHLLPNGKIAWNSYKTYCKICKKYIMLSGITK